GGLEGFAKRCETARADLQKILFKLNYAGKRIIAYGASAKGTIVLNYCGIGRDLVEYVIDSTPAKQGKYVPGTHQLIVPEPRPADLSTYDAILVLAWNHLAEIQAKHPEFKGEWILPHGAQ